MNDETVTAADRLTFKLSHSRLTGRLWPSSRNFMLNHGLSLPVLLPRT
jgi:hypothetical protein